MNANDIFSNRVVQTASIGVASFAAGGVLGYFLGKRNKASQSEEEQLSFTFETVDEEGAIVSYEVVGEVDADTEHDTIVESFVEGFESQDDEVAPKIERPTKLEWIGPDPRDEPAPEQEYVDISNVFDGNDNDEWDEEEELSKRTNDAPYIITVGEFISNDSGFTQSTLTFYTGDRMVTDEYDVPVYNWDNVLGTDNIKFGHGSDAEGVVYIRNVVRKAEFEVIEFEGYYAQEKLGLEAEEDLSNEIQHSDRSPRRFRMKD